VRDGAVACFTPGETAAEARLNVERYAPEDRTVEARIRFLGSGPDLDLGGTKPLAISNLPALREPASDSRAKNMEARSADIREQSLVLLTNGSWRHGAALRSISVRSNQNTTACSGQTFIQACRWTSYFCEARAGMGECRRLSYRRSISGISHLFEPGATGDLVFCHQRR